MTTQATPLSRATSATAHAVTESVARVRAAAPGWVGGALAGVQAALFSLALVLIPVWVAAAAASDANVSWSESSGAATRMWLVGFGVPWAVEGVPITLVPLGIPALAAIMLSQLARRFAAATWVAGFATVAAFAATVGVTTTLAWSGAEDTSARMLGAVAWAALLAIPAVGWGLMRQRGATMAWLHRIPASVRGGVRMGAAMTSSVVVAASLVLIVSTVSSRHQIADAATGLGVDTAGGVALAFLETAYAPTLVVWVVSWLSGAGFALGGVLVSSAQPLPDTMPAVPLMWSLPSASGGGVAWSPVVVVVLGAAVVIALRSRIGSGWMALGAIGIGVGLVAAAIGAASALARGAMGPDSLAAVGPQPVVAAVLIAAELALGAVVAWVFLRVVAPRGKASATATSPRSSPPARRDTPVRTESRPDT
ncbi:DUF6350 family protein [Demequina sp.]|uniref:cell division protein PerM n=1 Tax=Demequina sp. TaxID=2050685 RepID=UPI0025C10096|nr:DUF6350 family protein [Demequina sp.]